MRDPMRATTFEDLEAAMLAKMTSRERTELQVVLEKVLGELIEEVEVEVEERQRAES